MESPRTNIAVGELVFSLYQRPIHPELFTIYASRQIKTEQYEAVIWVTNCSHVLSVFVKDLCLTELINAPDQMLPQHKLLERFQFSGQRSHKCTLSKNLSYMTDFQIEKMSPNLYRQSQVDLQTFARTRGIFVRFPDQSVGGLEPFSYIDFEARKTELQVHTFHAYPEQVTIIKTQSLFQLH